MSVKKAYSISEEAYRNKLDYIAEYNKKMARLTIQLTPEDKAEIKRIADEKGMTMKDLITNAIKEYVRGL
jgi:predicted DNA binding CopG/RHH family protein